jgi:MFS family permease
MHQVLPLAPRNELFLSKCLFYIASLSGAFGGKCPGAQLSTPRRKPFVGLLATAILKMDGIGNLAGWRWIFVLEGLATVISGIIAAALLPASLESASFLTEEERAFAGML